MTKKTIFADAIATMLFTNNSPLLPLMRSSYPPCRPRLHPPNLSCLSSSPSSTPERQQQERDDYYNLILFTSLKSRNPLSKPTMIDEPKNNKRERSSQKVIFSSRLAGPATRQKERWAQERPPEPDNCCMSGCANCVWDTYREEVEEWAAKGNTSVLDARVSQGQAGETTGTEDLDRLRTSEFQSGGLFERVPVGIREFMALEKKLREKEVREEGKG